MRIPLKAAFILLLPLATFGQKIVAPGSPDINAARLKPGKSLYTIYYVQGTTWTKKGTYTNDISVSGNELTFVANFNDENDKWYRRRTSVVDAQTLNPISFKNEGLKNTLTLNFGSTITGKYHYTTGEKDKVISVKSPGKFIDYNLADAIFTTLPLSTGYKATIPEFFYTAHPDSLIGDYTIKDVKSYIQRSPKTGNHESWLVSVLEVASGAVYTYIVDKKDYRVWQREMPAGNGITEICVDEELDYQPIKAKFDKTLSLQMLENGNGVIIGRAFARDHSSGRGIAVVNTNKAQFAPKGTVVSILPNSAYLEEWKEVNKKIRKKGKVQEVPIDPNVAACIKKTTVYDDKGHFEFTNLMPGEYILLTTFGYTHKYSYSYYAGQSNLVHPSGAVLSSSPIYNTASAATGATADIEMKVTIKSNNDKVEVNLKDVR
jgi:hypothetical protein